MTALTKKYESVIVKFRGDLNETPLLKLRKEVVLQYKTLVKTRGNAGSESGLCAIVSKYKGFCSNCGKFGHEANECRSNKVESTDGATNDSGTNLRDRSQVTCYNCQQKGHFANKCTLPRKLKSEVTADMGMFVGASYLDGPTNERKMEENCVTDNFFDIFDDSMSVCEEDGMFGAVALYEGINDSDVVITPTVETAVITLDDYVELASPVGLTEELSLLDPPGAICGVAYDNALIMNEDKIPIKSTDDSDMFSELEIPKKDLVILHESPVIPMLSEEASVPLAEYVRAPIVPTGVIAPAWRNRTSSVGQGAITRALACQVEDADVSHWCDDEMIIGTMDTEENLAGIIVVNALLQSDPQLGVFGQVKISDIGKMKRRFGADYAFVYDKHDLVGNWYDPQTTEDVKLYCTTDAVSSTTVSDGQYITRDSISISAGCSVDHELQHANDVGWTAVPTKHKCIEGRT